MTIKEKKLQEAKQVLEIENALIMAYKDIVCAVPDKEEPWMQALGSKRETMECIRKEINMFTANDTFYSENRINAGGLGELLNETRLQTIKEQGINDLIKGTIEIEMKLLGNDFYREYEGDSENVKDFIRIIRKNKEKEINLIKGR